MTDFSAALAHLYYLKMITLFERKINPGVFGAEAAASCAKKTPLDPHTILKYHSRLAVPPVFAPLVSCGDPETQYFAVDISEFKQQVLPEGMPLTTVWGYGGFARGETGGEPVYRRCWPGPTFEAVRGTKMRVKWINRLVGPHLFAVDPTLHWANPNGMPHNPRKPWPDFPPGFRRAQWPVPVVTHVHGGENAPQSDGFPEAWFTYRGDDGAEGADDLYTYHNRQEPATLWYHDHTLGITRLNVCAGLAGFYLLRDPTPCDGDSSEKSSDRLPHGPYELPLVIQDRSFYTDGSLAFTTKGNNPDIHPYWDPEFFGDAVTVNGKTWPTLSVSRRQYRFRMLNGSNARFYHLYTSAALPIWQIGTDGGYLDRPVPIQSLLLAPAERADLVVDFSHCSPGDQIILCNDAPAPYPGGGATDPETTGQIMRFEVEKSAAVSVPIPKRLNDIPMLRADRPERRFTLDEVSAAGGPTAVLINNRHWMDPVTENPRVGSTEDWVFANLTMDTHPMHLHLIEFELWSRQDFDADAYKAAVASHKEGPLPLPEDFATGKPMMPDPNERGWKDTVRMNPGQITRIRVRFAEQRAPVCKTKPGDNTFPFDPTSEPGYVYHCHILDHEDNDMMRPYKVTR